LPGKAARGGISAGLSKEAAVRMAVSTARNVLAGIDGKLDPSMVVDREVL
jgi:D-3-phosphoglycerate dehydrogenase / 2-oxoglutarate reductase